MVSAIDRGNALILAKEDFNRAMSWLLEAEIDMSKIFKATSEDSDSAAMDEIYHYIQSHGKVDEHKLIRFTRERVPSHAVLRVIEIMEKSGMIQAISVDKLGLRTYISVGGANAMLQ